ncbi:MAG TPA: hypothetical protein PKO06_18215 [Candidatus Ozemobacteraceae bacterium]|nr:hypothetical protein [Candidatus Ozemobacteraceae bacterium]
MKTFFPCPKCASEKIIPEIAIHDRDDCGGDTLGIRIDSSPEAWLFKNPHIVELRATICCDCGYTEFFSSGDLNRLWNLHQQQHR